MCPLPCLQERLDARGGLDVLANMKLAGIQPNQVSERGKAGWAGLGWAGLWAELGCLPARVCGGWGSLLSAAAGGMQECIACKETSPATCPLVPLSPLPPLAPPAQASYRHLIALMVRAGQPHAAVQLCAEAHEVGALRAYALPNLAGGSPQPGTALGNVIDLRWGSRKLLSAARVPAACDAYTVTLWFQAIA